MSQPAPLRLRLGVPAGLAAAILLVAPASTGSSPAAARAQAPIDPIDVVPADGWTLTFSDSFSGDSLNASSWTVSNRSAVVSRYDGHDALFIPERVRVRDGHLAITTVHEPSVLDGQAYNFTSGWIDSQQKVNRSLAVPTRWEASIQMAEAEANGAWPAWWLLPEGQCWPVSGEVDIVEVWLGQGHYQRSHPGLPVAMACTCEGIDTLFARNPHRQPGHVGIGTHVLDLHLYRTRSLPRQLLAPFPVFPTLRNGGLTRHSLRPPSPPRRPLWLRLRPGQERLRDRLPVVSLAQLLEHSARHRLLGRLPHLRGRDQCLCVKVLRRRGDDVHSDAGPAVRHGGACACTRIPTGSLGAGEPRATCCWHGAEDEPDPKNKGIGYG